MRVKAISHVAYFVADLPRMSAFLTDFGLHLVAEDGERLYMGGVGAAPYLHVSVRSSRAGLAWIAFEVETAEDLAEAAGMEGASPMEPVPGPVPRSWVKFRDPDGVEIRLVHWDQAQEAVAVGRSEARLNSPVQRERLGATVRVDVSDAKVFRLGHVLLNVADVETSGRWYATHLGMRLSDSLHAGARDDIVGGFYRLARGEEYVDHHTMGFVRSAENPGTAHHASFEVGSFDAVGTSHQYLVSKGWAHRWGVGRHVLGSQIFDYWYDPEGNIVEHYADGDVFNESHLPGSHVNSPDILAQWAPPLPHAVAAKGQR